MRQPTKAQTLYFKRQLDVRDEQLESDPNPESYDCKIWKWMNDINPQNGLGPCPCPEATFKRVLSAPHSLSALFSGAQAALSIGHRRSKRRNSKSSNSSQAASSKPASTFSRTDSAISENSNWLMFTLTHTNTRTTGSDTVR